MRKILSLTVACLLTSWMSAQTVANMDSLKAEKKTVATSIKLTGKLTTVGNSDFRQMRDLCWQLRHVDLSASDCPSIPKNAFHSRLAITCNPSFCLPIFSRLAHKPSSLATNYNLSVCQAR